MANPQGRFRPVIWHWLLVVLTFLAMLPWTWLGWNDPIIDFGRELYVPWQLLGGKVLYRDLAYFNGPLSPYFNAFFFGLLGVSLRSLVFLNLCILAAITALIWKLFSIAADRLTATVVSIILLTVFSFIQLGGIGNYNFAAPYSHELTHGIALSVLGVACIYLASCASEKPARKFLLAGGFVLGLIFLTKAEVFLAAIFSMGIGLMLWRFTWRQRAAFIMAIPAAPGTALLLFCLAMPASQASRGVLGSWIYLFDRRITGLPFYRTIMGTADVSQSLREILSATIILSTITAAAAGAAFLLPKRPWSAWLAGTISVCLAILFFRQADLGVWQQSVRGLSIISPIIAAAALISSIRSHDPPRLLRAMLAIFGAVLLAKIALNVRVYHYGFALAMPATLVAFAAGLHWLPQVMQQRRKNAPAARAVMLAAAGLFVFVHLYVFQKLFSGKSLLVGDSPDQFYASMNDPRARAVNSIIHALKQLPTGATVAALPEGAMLEYLARRTNPTPYISLMPPEVLMFGQERIVKAFAEHPPDYIVMIEESNAAEYGYRGFSIDYGEQINRWIGDNYIEITLPSEQKYPISLLQRK